MKLTDLQASFVSDYTPEGFREIGDTIEGAQGLIFICPKCQGHSVLCWFTRSINAEKVPDDALPGPGRWKFTGTSLADATLSPSIDLSRYEQGKDMGKSCKWHGFVKNGEAKPDYQT
jgi:hypothetical protein